MYSRYTEAVVIDLQKHFGVIVNTMNDGLFLVDVQGRIVLANNSLARITGFDRDELEGRTCQVLGCDVCEESRAKGAGHWCNLFRLNQDGRKNCFLRHKSGAVVHVLKNAAILRDEGGAVIGAVETVTDLSELDVKERAIQELKEVFGAESGFCGMIGASPPMRSLFELLKRAAQSDAPVLLLGESGVGKEAAAHCLHSQGPRSTGPYVRINCAALNESLLESELFGHAKGAFTGAVRDRIGRLEEAGSGDVFLDEIGDAPHSIQVKLLRVLENKTFERVGENVVKPFGARVVAATNRDPEALVASGAFRRDFYFRINVIPIRIPPLRERREDIPLLIEHFLKRIPPFKDRPEVRAGADAMRLFFAHDWPGNVRELRSALEYAAVVWTSGPILPEHLPPSIAGGVCLEPTGAAKPPYPDADRTELIAALETAGGNKSQAARILGVSRLTVLNRMKKHGVTIRKSLA